MNVNTTTEPTRESIQDFFQDRFMSFIAFSHLLDLTDEEIEDALEIIDKAEEDYDLDENTSEIS